MGRALLTDLYELNMAASYLRRGMDGTATFSLFVRELPPTRGFLVAAGLEACLAFLEDLRFEPEDLDYLRDELGFDERALEAFRDLRFTGDVWAVPEGRIVLAEEPLLEVTAPIAQGQLVETFLLNRITLETMLASKAARCVIAAGGRELVDFSMRRTHGPDAAEAVARTSAMVGFVATSNVEAARRLGLRAAGTMAHSYVEAFPTEREAFRAFAQDYPARCTFLVDTFDTLEGVRIAIEVIRDRGLEDGAIRLDSGDLQELAAEARRLLDDAGLGRVRIFASGGLDELQIEELVGAGAPIDAFGVGTRLGVSADAPYLDSVYKLVEYADRPVAKLSTGKASPPGPKQVFRGDGPAHDVLALRGEDPPPGSLPLLEPAMEEGRRLRAAKPLSDATERFRRDIDALPEEARRLEGPVAPAAHRSERLQALADELRAEHGGREPTA
jgi:nicotinate phosphoribosyltransferase